MTTTQTTDISADSALRATITQFLATEARLLDEGRENEWLDLLDEEMHYEVPIRQATEPRSDEYSQPAYRLYDSKTHLRTRMARLETGLAYSEVPPSRTMRLVGSIEITVTEAPDVVSVASSILVYRQRGIDPHFDLIPARRIDTIRLTEAGPLLLTRRVLNVETSLETPNLAVIL